MQIGLGVMGVPMACDLAGGGHDIAPSIEAAREGRTLASKVDTPWKC